MSKATNPKFQSTAAREKYDQEFSDAMKLKLKLNREGGLQALRRSIACLLYTSPSPRDQRGSRMPSSA